MKVKENGMSLIALVVTIIVLILLAGVQFQILEMIVGYSIKV